jgi:hypothetical protein
MRIFALIVFVFDLAAQAGALKITESADSNPVAKMVCKGTMGKEIKETGITAGALKAGVPCLVGDFDSDGSKDFALLRSMDGGEAHKMWVVLTQEGSAEGVLSVVIPTLSGKQERGFFFARVFDGKNQSALPPEVKGSSCKFPKSDFIFEFGEGATNYVIAHNNSKFEVFSTCRSDEENNSDSKGFQHEEDK